MTGDHIDLQISNTLAELVRVREVVDRFGERHELPFSCVFAVKLALCELLANTISYGYEDQSPHTIDIRLELREGYVQFEIVDDGIEFNPTVTEVPTEKHTLKELPAGGYGIHLTNDFVDTLDYRRDCGRNHILATKKAVDA